MKVQAGSTVLIPVGGSDGGYLQGFASEFTKGQGEFDDQRGELVFYLKEPVPGSPAECPSGPAGGFKLKTRYVTRVAPDITSKAGTPSSFLSYGGETLAVVDIPPVSASGPDVGTSECTYVVEIKHHRRDLSDPSGQTWEPETPFSVFTPPAPIRLTIVPGAGTSTPAEVFMGALGVYGYELDYRLVDTFPFPQVVVVLAPGALDPNTPAPARSSSTIPIRRSRSWESRSSRTAEWARLFDGR
jgi:hypothetical protein